MVSVPPQRMGVHYGSGVQPATAYNPHPYIHPYLNNNNQQPNTYPNISDDCKHYVLC